jgi:RimJ/RimL family protein N-acetyltransferase
MSATRANDPRRKPDARAPDRRARRANVRRAERPAIYEYENEPPTSPQWLRERYTRLESRRSPDGRQQWLNWVIRLPTSELAGYVQATVEADGRAAIAYELSSAHWGRGLAARAVQAMITELGDGYRVRLLTAVLKRDNQRSRRLLERLGFTQRSDWPPKQGVEADELFMQRELGSR